MNMKKLLSIPILATMLVSLFGTGLATTRVVYATPASDACESVKIASPTVDCTAGKVTDSSLFKNTTKTVLNVLSVLVGIISIIMIIIGGFRYVVSGGDSNSTKGAKDTILYAVIGLVIVLFAQVIVRFVFDNAT